jgi:hypothetical protein
MALSAHPVAGPRSFDRRADLVERGRRGRRVKQASGTGQKIVAKVSARRDLALDGDPRIEAKIKDKIGGRVLAASGRHLVGSDARKQGVVLGRSRHGRSQASAHR